MCLFVSVVPQISLPAPDESNRPVVDSDVAFTVGTNVSVYPGRSVSLSCIAFGRPNAMIRWTLPSGTEVSAGQLDASARASVAGDGTLTIDSTEQSDSGTYTCSARNAGGETRRSSGLAVYGMGLCRILCVVTLTHCPFVSAAPSFTVTPASSARVNDILLTEVPVQAAPGDTVSFGCVASGPPTPTVAWLKGSQPVVETDLITVDSNGRLTIRNYGIADTGTYTCQAKNVMGSGRSSLEVLRPGFSVI